MAKKGTWDDGTFDHKSKVWFPGKGPSGSTDRKPMSIPRMERALKNFKEEQKRGPK
jgi:hypothetical protein